MHGVTAPSFDGQSSWFEVKDLIDDWVNSTTLSAEKLGPSLKNALTGNAEYYKKMLDNQQLRDERRGVEYFKDTLRPYLVKGAITFSSGVLRSALRPGAETVNLSVGLLALN